AVGPDNAAGLRIDRMDKDAHEGPNAGREVDLALVQHGSAAGWPARNEPIVAQNPAPRRPAADLPEQLAFGRTQAIPVAIVGDKVDAIIVCQRGQANRPFGAELPQLRAAARVVSGDVVVDRGRDEDSLAGDDRLWSGVEL